MLHRDAAQVSNFNILGILMDYRVDSLCHIIFAMTARGYPSTLNALRMFISVPELPELT